MLALRVPWLTPNVGHHEGDVDDIERVPVLRQLSRNEDRVRLIVVHDSVSDIAIEVRLGVVVVAEELAGLARTNSHEFHFISS